MSENLTRIAMVMQDVRSKIAARNYLPGSRLPSVRAQAKTLGVSVSTVVEGYERLAAENVILARPGAGFLSVARWPRWIWRKSARDSTEISIRCGCPASRWKPMTVC